MATNVYITANLDIDIGYDTDLAFAITVLDSAGSAYDFSNKTDSDFNVYEEEGGTLVKNWGEHASEGLSYASNVVTLNAAWTASLFEPGRSYFYEITYEDDTLTNPTHKIIAGKMTIEGL